MFFMQLSDPDAEKSVFAVIENKAVIGWMIRRLPLGTWKYHELQFDDGKADYKVMPCRKVLDAFDDFRREFEFSF